MTAPSRYLLLVTADSLLADITSFRLELLGYEVHVAGCGEQALQQVRERLPDVLLVHLDLPKMSGTAFIEMLATEQETAGLPILAISPDSDMELVQRTIAAGAQDFLVVPFDPLVLEDKVTELLKSKSTKKTTETAAAGGKG